MARRKCRRRRRKKEASREHFACHFLNSHHGRTKRQHSPLYVKREGTSLARLFLLPVLPHHRAGLLVAVYVLARGAGRRRTHGAPLASLGLLLLHRLAALGVS